MNIETMGTSKRIWELDGLRGAAILFVLAWHYFYFFPTPEHHPTGPLRALFVQFERCVATGWTGVNLFFVLSGFLIGGILMDAKGSPNFFKAFYARRFYRIIPLFYIWTAGYVLMLLVLRSVPAWNSHASNQLGWWPILSHFAFMQNLGFLRYKGIAMAWFGPTWSLAVEEQFYLLVPLVISLLNRRSLPAILLSVVIAAPLIRLGILHFLHPTINVVYLLMPCRADGLALGVLAAYFWRDRAFCARLSKHLCVLYGLCAVFFAGAAALTLWSPDKDSIAMMSIGYTWFDCFYVLILLLVLFHPVGPVGAIARMKFLGYVGRVSYCLYIVHQTVLYVVSRRVYSLVTFSPGTRIAIAPLIAIGISLGIASLSWRFFESKLIVRGHSYHYWDAQPASPLDKQ